jgi:hypothetical protein
MTLPRSTLFVSISARREASLPKRPAPLYISA